MFKTTLFWIEARRCGERHNIKELLKIPRLFEVNVCYFGPHVGYFRREIHWEQLKENRMIIFGNDAQKVRQNVIDPDKSNHGFYRFLGVGNIVHEPVVRSFIG